VSEETKEQQSEVKATESTEKPNAFESEKVKEQQAEKARERREAQWLPSKACDEAAIYWEAKATQSEETDEIATELAECIQSKKACHDAAIQLEER
jgi:hypothetical protein